MKALTLRQPWAWAIINAGKDIENRNWKTHSRGRVAIHAAAGMTRGQYEEACEYIRNINHSIRIPEYGDLERGAIIGMVEIIDCVQASDSFWFMGKYGFVLAHSKRLREPIPCKGALSFWSVPPNIEARMKKAI